MLLPYFMLNATFTTRLSGKNNAKLPQRLGLEALALCLVLGGFVFIAWSAAQFSAPVEVLLQQKMTLDADMLPFYGLRTSLRMLSAMVFSFVFTLIYASFAAKNARFEQILVPLLDILQSVPVLGYISFTVTAFVSLFPHSMLGVEMAAIFAIFTSQVWNMTFSLYQSLKSVPKDMREAATMFKLSGWQKFWRMELPFAMPSLIWNMMMSMSGGWFFVVASEAITVGNKHIMLPGIGSYIALAIAQQNVQAIGYAIGMMGVIILLYDQLLFRPLLAWADKFRYETTMSQQMPHSAVLDLLHRSWFANWLLTPCIRLVKKLVVLRIFCHRPLLKRPLKPRIAWKISKFCDYTWPALLMLLGFGVVMAISRFIFGHIGLDELMHALFLAGCTFLRVVILIIIASLIWLPLGVLIGLRPKLTRWVQPLAQFLAAFPANLLFPVAVMMISAYQLNPDIWLSPLIILGTQWYILFNVIAGASALPNDLREAAKNLNVRGWLWWRRVALPGVMPYYLTGAITASGGAWNASIVAEMVSWGAQRFTAHGLGAYIAEMTMAGDFNRIALGIGVMVVMVVAVNRLFWRPLYDYTARKLRMD